jgi:hypothetical protein
MNPTAQQCVASAQLTLCRTPFLATRWADQCVPFQRSISAVCAEVWAWVVPTAKQCVLEGQSTPSRKLSFPASEGSLTTLHARPFQCSAKGLWLEDACTPTIVQLRADAQLTARGWAFGGVGACT